MLHIRLLEMRKKKGVTQAEVAKYLNITHQAYSLYEKNKNQMNYETLCLLADYYGISTDYLLGRQERIPSFLNEEERLLIDQYRALDERAKGTINNYLSFERSRTEK